MEADQELVLITHGTDTMCQTAQYLVRAGVGQGIDFGPGVGEKVGSLLHVASSVFCIFHGHCKYVILLTVKQQP